MTHVIRFEKLNDNGISESASAIYDLFHAQGKIVDYAEVVTLAGAFGYLRFVDEAAADEYLAEMAAINEDTNTGNDRGPLTRYDE